MNLMTYPLTEKKIKENATITSNALPFLAFSPFNLWKVQLVGEPKG